MAQDQAPLNASWSVIWARGNQETIRRANALLAACTDLIGVGTSIQAAATLRQRLKRNVVGSTWTEEERAAVGTAMQNVAHARKNLAEQQRRILRKRHAELFTPEGSLITGAMSAKPPTPEVGSR